MAIFSKVPSKVNQRCLSLTPFDQNMIRNQGLSFSLTILSTPGNFQGSDLPIIARKKLKFDFRTCHSSLARAALNFDMS